MWKGRFPNIIIFLFLSLFLARGKKDRLDGMERIVAAPAAAADGENTAISDRSELHSQFRKNSGLDKSTK